MNRQPRHAPLVMTNGDASTGTYAVKNAAVLEHQTRKSWPRDFASIAIGLNALKKVTGEVHDPHDAGSCPHLSSAFAGNNPDDDVGNARENPRMAHDELIRRLDEYLAVSHLSDRAASIASGGGPDVIRDLRRRGKRVPPGDRLARLERAIGAPPGYLLAAVDDLEITHQAAQIRESQVARRLKATRMAAYSTIEIACADLGVPQDVWLSMESGQTEPAPDLVMKFCALNGVPLRWIERGVMDGLPAVLAARVGLFDGGLVPPFPDEEGQENHLALQERGAADT